MTSFGCDMSAAWRMGSTVSGESVAADSVVPEKSVESVSASCIIFWRRIATGLWRSFSSEISARGARVPKAGWATTSSIDFVSRRDSASRGRLMLAICRP